ncbi:MAG: VWA domain-containing protein, partial [Chloroflexi bacterium]|nr:VWA domain-containing protein [Chloroflexota bacterium]
MATSIRQYGLVASASVLALILLFTTAGLAGPPPRAYAQTACATTIDFMLVLDGSESINSTEFEAMRSFADGLIGHFTISPADAHAGIVQFASEGQGVIEIGLSSDPGAIATAISAMTQIVGITDIQEGIALAQQELTAGGRPDVPHVILVLTDGVHNEPGDPIAEAEAARSLGTEIFAIAVGPKLDIDQLNAIASDPDGEHVFSVDSFEALATILDPLVLVVCPPTPTPTPTSTLTPTAMPTLMPTATPPVPPAPTATLPPVGEPVPTSALGSVIHPPEPGVGS